MFRGLRLLIFILFFIKPLHAWMMKKRMMMSALRAKKTGRHPTYGAGPPQPRK
jgi:hypothetical protein